MKRTAKYVISALLLIGVQQAVAQQVVPVGKGSYASYTPLELCHSEYHVPDAYGWKGDQSKYMQYRKLYLHERAGQPVPTNDWWTNLITQPYSGRMWAYPQIVQAQARGVDVQLPSFWIDNGTEMKSNTVLTVGGKGFAPTEAVAESWHDWDVEFSMRDGNKLMYVTMAHGMPFTWIEMRNVVPQISLARTGHAEAGFTATAVEVLGDDGLPVSGKVTTSRVALRMGADVYGLYLPEGSEVTAEGGTLTVRFRGAQQYVSVGVLHNIGELAAMAEYAYSVPRETRVTWQYAAAEGKMKTRWSVTADDLRCGVRIPDIDDTATPPAVPDEPERPADDGSLNVGFGDGEYGGPAHAPNRNAMEEPGSGQASGVPTGDVRVLQGFMPHHYRDTGNDGTLPLTGMTYATPHGQMRMAAGTDFEIDYNFYGMLPYYAAPMAGNSTKSPYREDVMREMLTSYADNGTFGADTYWGGKGLTQMGLNMMFAREMGDEALFRKCRDKLKAALVNWLTYTPGEKDFFFARYDRWGAMVGYGTSYDSDTFNDHHFHYGYFTYAAALLALVDDDFRNNYGDMITLIAKDYANWDRSDTSFPLFRTFDPWAGHSFAGGMGDDNGNGQESTSEAMQGWGGVYMLGVALGDDEMRDAGLFGWLSEARGTAEYWFDRHKDAATGGADYHTKTTEGYNIPYSTFTDGEGNTPPYNSNLTCHGVGWWTYFGYDAIFMQGIQWMPISPALDYLSEDKAFAAWDYARMWKDRRIGGWLKADETKDGYLGDSGGWGNVVLSYLQRSDPEEAARIFDMCWEAGEPEIRSYGTNGITYFITHSHLTHGDLDWSIHASIPTARAYRKADGSITYMAFNPKDAEQTVAFSDGKTLTVPARQLAVSGVTSKAVTDITPDQPAESDPREELEMVNLALDKKAESSGNENDITQNAGMATDGNGKTRWASKQADGQWLSVDLGKEAYIYKVCIDWEAAFASEYRIMLSADGASWSEAKRVASNGGRDEIMLGDAEARYVKMECLKRKSDAWGISMYEIQVMGAYKDAALTDLLGVKITAGDDVLTQYQPCRIGIKGYTVGREWTDVAPVWTSKDGRITDEGVFTPRTYPSATVTAQVGTLRVSKALPVEEAMFTGAISLSPRIGQVPVGDVYRLTVEVQNQFLEPMNVNPDNVDYRLCTYDEAKRMTDTDAGRMDKAAGEVTFSRAGSYAVIAVDGEATDTVYVESRDFSDINLALNRPATATSSENDGMDARYATDGNRETRWGSIWGSDYTQEVKDNQSITVDLEGTYSVNRVRMLWQDARAAEYQLQVSADGQEWQTVQTVKESPKDETVTFTETPARYVRMQGVKRNMDYGYSIYEFEVYGTKRLADASAALRDKGINTLGAHELEGKWNAADFAAIDAANGEELTAYDLRGVTIPEGTSFDMVNPNALVLISAVQEPCLTNSANVIVAGEAGYSARNIEFTDGHHVNTSLPVIANSVVYRRPMMPGYDAIALPFGAGVPAGITLYGVTGMMGDDVRIAHADAVAANIPYVVRSEGGVAEFKAADTMVSFEEKSIAAGDYTFVSNYAFAPATSLYGVSMDGDLPVFVPVGNGMTSAFRAYLAAPQGAADVIRITSGELSSIYSVSGNATVADVYSLDGRLLMRGARLDRMPKGVYIVNGRKVVF